MMGLPSLHFILFPFKENVVYLFFGFLPVAFEKLILTTPLAFCLLEERSSREIILDELPFCLLLLFFLANIYFSCDCLVNFVKSCSRLLGVRNGALIISFSRNKCLKKVEHE